MMMSLLRQKSHFSCFWPVFSKMTSTHLKIGALSLSDQLQIFRECLYVNLIPTQDDY